MRDYVVFSDVSKYYQMGQMVIKAIDHINFSIAKGEFCIIVGPSGAGKTTVLNMLGGMDTCTEGTISVDGTVISGFSSKELTTYRRYDVGFVFQFYNLVQNLTALENVELASQICRDPLDAATAVREVGLEDRMDNFPSQLSGGEQQRISIARALAKNPKLLLCVVITHNSALTPMADHVIHIKNGTVAHEEYNNNPTPVESIEW